MLAVTAVLLGGCLVNRPLYDERSAELRDDDGDGYSESQGDCNDNNPYVSPGQDESCGNGEDDDCNGEVDEPDAADAQSWYDDDDGDGFGDDTTLVVACEPPTDDMITTGGDCDDLDADINPDAEEVCGDGVDNNCNDDAGECAWPEELSLSEQVEISGDTQSDAFGAAGVLVDWNGDGQLSLTVSAPNAAEPESGTRTGGTFVFDGPLVSNETADQADTTWWNSTVGDLGEVLVAVDLNSDGYPDLITGNHRISQDGLSSSGEAYVFYGPMSNVAEVGPQYAAWVLWGSEDQEQFGKTVHGLTGFTEDGTDGIAIGNEALTINGSEEVGRLAFYDADGKNIDWSDEAARAVISGTAEDDRFGARAVTADLNADGLRETYIAAPGADGGSGCIYGFAPDTLAAATTSAHADTFWSGSDLENSGTALVSADLDGDGADDLLATGPATGFGSADVVLGGPALDSGFPTDSDLQIVNTGAEHNLGAQAVIADVDGDQHHDIVLSESTSPPTSTLVFYGPLSGGTTLQAADAGTTIRDDGAQTSFDFMLAGELTGGGSADLVIGSRTADSAAGLVTVIPGATW